MGAPKLPSHHEAMLISAYIDRQLTKQSAMQALGLGRGEHNTFYRLVHHVLMQTN